MAAIDDAFDRCSDHRIDRSIDHGRRRFLALTAAAALAGPVRVVATGQRQRLLSCRRDDRGKHFATLFDTHGQSLLDVPLPGRGHDIVVAPDGGTAVVVARRPGTFLVVLDLVGRRVAQQVAAAPDRHFYGHAVFSADGTLLYATENAYDSGDGRIGIYEVARGFRRIGEISSHGIGPHELLLLADGRTLLVANGGIRTHPDMPRAKLNLDRMHATLTYVDRHDGRLIEQQAAPAAWQRLSIRHIAVSHDDTVAIAMQYEGDKRDRPPLIGVHRRGDAPRWLHAPKPVQAALRNYCGSVAWQADGDAFLVSSPHGGLVTRWSHAGDYLGNIAQTDVCGIATTADGLWTSDGRGGLRHIVAAHADDAVLIPNAHWDNHMIAL